MREKDLSEKQQHDPKHVKMAVGIASDPRHKGGDYTGAHKKIEKIAKGLASHPQVAAVLKKQNEAVKEGLGELAHAAERDHEVQMARAELYKLAKYAIKLHEILKGVSEAEGLEGWVQSKITKSADMIGSVYHHLDYQESPMAEVTEAVEMCPEACCGKPVTECSCGPDCKHCDCHSKNAAMKEGKRPLPERGSRAKKNKKAMEYKESLRARLEEKKAKNPYAVGMAQAMKSTGDEPPLEKSTIKKAHKIAKAVKKG